MGVSDYALLGSSIGRSGYTDRMAGTHHVDAAQLDRSFRRRGGRLSRSRQSAPNSNLYDPDRHGLWLYLFGIGAGSSARFSNHNAEAEEGGSRVHGSNGFNREG